MKRFAAFAICICVLLCCGCTGAENNTIGAAHNSAPKQINKLSAVKEASFDAWQDIREENPINDDTIAAINAFSAQTAAAALGTAQGNACFSPFSLYYALAMAACGAQGETAAELTALLGFEDTLSLAQQCGNIYRVLLSREKDGNGTLDIANSLWLANNYIDAAGNEQQVNYNEEYINTCAAQFYAEVYSADFASSKTAKEMAAWIKQKTNGTLEAEFNISPETIMSIINTVYLNDEWVDRFDKAKTAEDIFNKADGSHVRCDFMNSVRQQGFFGGSNYIAAGVSMKNYGSMLFVLPNEGTSVNDIITDTATLAEILAGGKDQGYGKVTFKIPKFSFGSSFELVQTLQKLGLNKSFESDADFSGIMDANAFISGVLQQTHISIDEKGVEASAFTQIDYAGAGMPQDNADIILDKPFIFIINSRYGPLFMGVVNDPTAN